MDTPVLQTERHYLRPIEIGDVEAFWPTFNNADAMRWWSRAPFTDKQELADWLLDTDWAGRTWVAIPASGGPAVCRVVATLHEEGVSEIGYLTVLGAQGQGIARECVAALVSQLFTAENNRRVWADVDPENAASNALLERLGFTHEGTLRAAWKTHIGIRDSYIWGLLATDWRN
ncbi:GNAT family protein [Altererythrobacter aquiaggeris]|uniref:GNAT family N-acetyltransferase n=1 Tax=Aestuarierythrobacter aquiaggeris TaxID=1898396 RepID=UPI003019311E